MQEVATSIDSVSSDVRVPSLREVLRKSIIARASRFLESRVDAWRVMVSGKGMVLKGEGGTMMALDLTGASIYRKSVVESLRIGVGSKTRYKIY